MIYYIYCLMCECSSCDHDGTVRELRWQACMVDCAQSLNDEDWNV